MNMCDEHWGALRSAVQAEGMASVKWDDTTRQHAEAQFPALASTTITAETFDPYASVYFAITDEVMRMHGIAAAFSDECPVCLTDARHKLECEVLDCDFEFAAYISQFAATVKVVFNQLFPS